MKSLMLDAGTLVSAKRGGLATQTSESTYYSMTIPATPVDPSLGEAELATGTHLSCDKEDFLVQY